MNLSAVACSLDPARLKLPAGVVLDPWQRDALRARHHRLVLNCCRGSGKSTVAAASVVDELVNVEDALAVIVAPALRQSVQLMRMVKRILSANVEVAPAVVQESVLSVELANGARALALPGSESTIRGHHATLVICDEASRIDADVYASIRPMVSVTAGRLALLSTPNGIDNTFWQTWTEGVGWSRVLVTAADVPRISEEYLAEMRQVMPRWQFRQEFFCEATQSDEAALDAEAIARALRSDVMPFFPHRKQSYVYAERAA